MTWVCLALFVVFGFLAFFARRYKWKIVEEEVEDSLDSHDLRREEEIAEGEIDVLSFEIRYGPAILVGIAIFFGFLFVGSVLPDETKETIRKFSFPLIVTITVSIVIGVFLLVFWAVEKFSKWLWELDSEDEEDEEDNDIDWEIKDSQQPKSRKEESGYSTMEDKSQFKGSKRTRARGTAQLRAFLFLFVKLRKIN